jgi:hypothetical protein
MPKTAVCGMTRSKPSAAGLPRPSRFTSRLQQLHCTPTRCSFRMANLSHLAYSQTYKLNSPPSSALLGLGVTQVPPSPGHLSCLEAGNPISGPGGRYWALASQNACARQFISTKNPLSQCAVCSDNQVQRMDEALDRIH